MIRISSTGDFIAQLNDGRQRRATAEKLHHLSALICTNQAPWVLHDVEWNGLFVQQLLDGAETGLTMVEHAASQLGVGDLRILTECHTYRTRTQLKDVQIWTLDAQLRSHS